MRNRKKLYLHYGNHKENEKIREKHQKYVTNRINLIRDRKIKCFLIKKCIYL